jgi:YD repeat-containing protein
VTVTGRNGSHVTNYTYDLNNRLTSETKTGAGIPTETYQYDNNGNITTKTHYTGARFNWHDMSGFVTTTTTTYNRANLPTTVTNAKPAQSPTTMI